MLLVRFYKGEGGSSVALEGQCCPCKQNEEIRAGVAFEGEGCTHHFIAM